MCVIIPLLQSTVVLQHTTIRMYLEAYIFPKFIGIFTVEMIVFVLSFVIMLNCHQRKCRCLQDKHIHLVLRQMKILEPGPNNSDNNPQSLLHGYEIPRLYVYVLALYFLFMLFGSGVVFFDIFLNVDLVFSCESAATGSECFLNYSEPIDCDNDSLTALLDNATLVCCKYNLDIGKAAGIAGGMITISMLIIKVITGCFLFLKRYELDVDHHSCKHCCRAMLICLTLTCQALILIMFLVIFSVSKLRNLLLTTTILFQFINFFGAIFITVTVPCCNFRSIQTPDEPENEENNPNTERTPLVNS